MRMRKVQCEHEKLISEDEPTAMRIVRQLDEDRCECALLDDDQVRTIVDVELLDHARPGMHVLVHAGVAIARAGADAAQHAPFQHH